METSRTRISRSSSNSATRRTTVPHTHALGLPDDELEQSVCLQGEEYLGNTQPDNKPKLPWWKTPSPWW